MAEESEKPPEKFTLSELALKLDSSLAGEGRLTDEACATVLWKHVGSDFDAGIRIVAGKLCVNPDDLTNVLADRAVLEAGAKHVHWIKRLWRWLKNHWPEFTLLTLAALAALLAVRATGALASLSPLLKPRSSSAVKAASGLPPFHVIRPEDLKQEEVAGRPEAGTFNSPEDVVGRYTLQALNANAALLEGQLSGVRLKPEELAERHLLSLPVKAGALSAAVAPPARVSLLLSPGQGAEKTPAPFLIGDVIVLAVERQGNSPSVVVAVPAGTNMAEVSARLGTSDVYVAQPAR